MSAVVHDVVPSPAGMARRRTGLALRTLVVLFLVFDAVGKVLRVPAVVTGTAELGYPDALVHWLGVVLLLCVAAYVVPRVSGLGAILLTGYLGGAVATHVRVGSPLLTHVLFPAYVAACAWAGLWLTDERVRRLLPVHGAGGRDD